jgi:hypothetical protein
MHPAMNRTSVFAGQVHDIAHPEDFIEVDRALHALMIQGWLTRRFRSELARRRVDREG